MTGPITEAEINGMIGMLRLMYALFGEPMRGTQLTRACGYMHSGHGDDEACPDECPSARGTLVWLRVVTHTPPWTIFVDNDGHLRPYDSDVDADAHVTPGSTVYTPEAWAMAEAAAEREEAILATLTVEERAAWDLDAELDDDDDPRHTPAHQAALDRAYAKFMQ